MGKKLFAIFVVLVAAAVQVFAQDIIIRTDDSSFEAKVISVGSQSISYSLPDTPEGHFEKIPVSEVLLIIYSDGTVERMGQAGIRQPGDADATSAQPAAAQYPSATGTQQYSPSAAEQQAQEQGEAVRATASTIMAKEDVKSLRQAQQEYYQKMAAAVYAVPDVRYRDIRGAFNPKEYVSQPWDPYQPVAAGLLSWLIPGVGQFTVGEPGKGAFYLASSLVCTIGWMSCFTIAPVFAMAEPVGFDDYDYDEFAREKNDAMSTCLGLGFAFLAAAITVEISSICNAVKVAKVKNMYTQDYIENRVDLGMDVRLSPSFACVPAADGLAPSAGLALRISF